MRIKYIYQQFISHISILIIAFIILSLLFAHFVENMVYENKVKELTKYGENILEDFDRAGQEFIFTQYQHVLNTQNISFSIFGQNGVIVYPVANNATRARLSDEDWNKLSRGEKIITKHNIKWANQEVSLVAIPYIGRGEVIGGILLISPISGSREMISEVNQYLLYTVIIALSVSFLLSWVLSKIHVNRIQKIRKATSKIANGDYDAYLPVSNFDEIAEMSNDFNDMIDQLKAQNEEIDSLEKRRRQFIADVSHELRTPLTTISGVIEGLKNNMIEEDEKEKGIQLVSQETKRLIRLVNENLDYERIRSNQVKLVIERIQLKEVLEVIKEHLLLQAEAKNIHLIIDVDEDSMVFADYDRLIQILINITKNSIQFTNEGSVLLRGIQGSAATIIEIEDTGIGMDKQEIESIWRRFYKADISRTSNQFGEFGLGLSIVKRLVELHKGEITITSERNRGTKFTITIPIKE
ncbi:sensor histidine kinase [Metabacillus sediminilitoris]|uniref:histidine kinase n=1 Tax=Metabacillus sediminilitoris TaxID=2567941 RepID=A0A4S4C117_9BACI|nr:HAMP domain-containing sensor histidine kinase [Metabacillus sediminilitoris]QGQ48853.1 HAMP domain-containing protein [Metabacillus sediminilitoris]THF81164.1 HAMP domain-containing histidine kinase [Metabacillus sediminilitoris]